MALVPGQNMLASGTGAWTISIPTNATIAIDDPPTRAPIPPAGPVTPADLATFPSVKLSVVLNSTTPSTMGFIGDISSLAPNPVDSVGFTAKVEIDVTNNTNQTLQGLVLNLANADQQMPFSLLPGVVEYGSHVNANYAYFTDVQPVAGHTTALFSPDGKPTTATGPAASKIAVTGPIAPGSTVSSLSTIHNTEQTISTNNFVLTVTPS